MRFVTPALACCIVAASADGGRVDPSVFEVPDGYREQKLLPE
jgi:hypothetical protein